jgi:hypothetical protein
MAPEEFICELKARLLMDQFSEDTRCPVCSSILDRRGRHAKVCACNGDRSRRHNAVRNRISRIADAARARPELEKPGLLPPSPEQPNATQRRPADIYIPSWKNGLPAALDIAITSPQRHDIGAEAARKSGAAAAAYEQCKRDYLDTAADCQRQGISFVPLVAEPSGGWGTSALCTLRALARSIALTTGRDSGTELRSHRQALCILIRQANARAIFRRDPGCNPDEPDALGVARLALQTV